MLRLRTFRITAALILLLLGVSAPSPARAGFVYQVSADTSSLNGQSGFIDLQFNPGGSAESATASVTGFQTTGTAAVLAASVVDTGDASGALPGTLTFDNGTGFNDIFQGITFGTGLSFQVTFSGPA